MFLDVTHHHHHHHHQNHDCDPATLTANGRRCNTLQLESACRHARVETNTPSSAFCRVLVVEGTTCGKAQSCKESRIVHAVAAI